MYSNVLPSTAFFNFLYIFIAVISGLDQCYFGKKIILCWLKLFSFRRAVQRTTNTTSIVIQVTIECSLKKILALGICVEDLAVYSFQEFAIPYCFSKLLFEEGSMTNLLLGVILLLLLVSLWWYKKIPLICCNYWFMLSRRNRVVDDQFHDLMGGSVVHRCRPN